MASKFLLLSPCISYIPSTPESKNPSKTHMYTHNQQPWNKPKPKRRLAVPLPSTIHQTLVSSAALAHPSSVSILLSESGVVGGYSEASYYTSLGLFVISVPGLWSLIKRSVKSKVCYLCLAID